MTPLLKQFIIASPILCASCTEPEWCISEAEIKDYSYWQNAINANDSLTVNQQKTLSSQLDQGRLVILKHARSRVAVMNADIDRIDLAFVKDKNDTIAHAFRTNVVVYPHRNDSFQYRLSKRYNIEFFNRNGGNSAIVSNRDNFIRSDDALIYINSDPRAYFTNKL